MMDGQADDYLCERYVDSEKVCMHAILPTMASVPASTRVHNRQTTDEMYSPMRLCANIQHMLLNTIAKTNKTNLRWYNYILSGIS